MHCRVFARANRPSQRSANSHFKPQPSHFSAATGKAHELVVTASKTRHPSSVVYLLRRMPAMQVRCSSEEVLLHHEDTKNTEQTFTTLSRARSLSFSQDAKPPRASARTSSSRSQAIVSIPRRPQKAILELGSLLPNTLLYSKYRF